MGNCTAHSAGFEQRAASGAGIVVSRAAPAGVSRVDQSAVGRERKQSQGAVLLADGCGQEAIDCGARKLAAAGRRGEPGAGGDIRSTYVERALVPRAICLWGKAARRSGRGD